MKNKKFLATCMAVVLSVVMLAGCTNEPSGGTANHDTEADTEAADDSSDDKANEAGDDGADSSVSEGEDVTLRFMWWGGDTRNEATLEVINQYMELHPNVTIEAEMASDDGYIEKVSTMLANGTAPDIMQQNVDSMPDFVSRGDFFVDFKEYSDIMDLSGFDDDFIEAFGNFDGKQYALPTGVACLALVVDMDLAEQFGVDIDSQLTWDSLYEMGKTVNEQDSDYYFLNVDTKILCEYVLRPYLRQVTGQTFIVDETQEMSFGQEQLVEVLDYINKCYEDKVFQAASESATFAEATHTNPKWIAGEFVAAFVPSSSINLFTEANPDGNYAVIKMPMAEDRVNDGYIADTPQYMTVNKNSANVEVAVDFLNYFYNSEVAAETLQDVRSIPPVENSRQLCADKGYLSEIVVDAVNLSLEMNGFSDKGLSTATESYAIQQDMIESIAYGQSSPQAAAEQAVDLIEDYLDGLN